MLGGSNKTGQHCPAVAGLAARRSVGPCTKDSLAGCGRFHKNINGHGLCVRLEGGHSRLPPVLLVPIVVLRAPAPAARTAFSACGGERVNRERQTEREREREREKYCR